MEQQRIWDHVQTTRVDFFEHARGRYTAMAALAARHAIRKPARVLNIGIGAGGVERILKDRGWQVAALDPSADVVEAQRRLGVDARCGFAQAMPFDSEAFDIVVASEVLEHIEPATRALALREVTRVLAPGGWFVGSVPHREVLADNEVICPDCGKVFHRWGHVSSFDLPGLRQELGGVFDAVSCHRSSFVDWASARTPMRLLRCAVHSVLGRLGEPIASPSIVFAACRRSGA